MAKAVLVIDMLRGFMEAGHPLYIGDKARRIIPSVRGLLERGILVRNFSRAPYLANCHRVTVGTPEENDGFLRAMEIVER